MFHNMPLNIVGVTFVSLPAKLPPWSHSVCRNYLYELFPLSDTTEKKFGMVKSGEHHGHMFSEMRQSPKTSQSTFTVSLTVCEVAPSCWNQRSCSSSSNKATNCWTKISPSTVDSKNWVPTILLYDTAHQTTICSVWCSTSHKIRVFSTAQMYVFWELMYSLRWNHAVTVKKVLSRVDTFL